MTDRLTELNAALAGRYRIERDLGAGGMALVYLAHDVRHDRRVAIKVLRPELSAILGAERFVAEIRTTANLQHPHILSLFESGEAAGLVYYVMPYIEGESLRDRLNREKQLPVDAAIRIAREIADALQYAHERGIVHRDIKPENILLHGGHAVVADFGIALAASRSEGSTRMTETGMSLGTPQYMSPEQAMGEREITPRADIYALGCVLYEMLSGDPPFMGSSAQAIVARVLTEEPRSLAQQRKTIPLHVDSTVQTALSKLPADRFATAREFGEALVTPGLTALQTAKTLAPLATRRRVTWLPWVIAGGAAVIAAVASLRPQEPPAVSRERVLVWDRAVLRGTLPLVMALSPDGNTIVFADSGERHAQLFLKRSAMLAATPLAGTEGALGMAFSPDGNSVVFAVDGKVKRMSLSGGLPVLVGEGANTLIATVAWLDDGTILYNTGNYGLTAVSAGGQARGVFNPAEHSVGVIDVRPLPGSAAVLITTCRPGCAESDLRVLNLRTLEVRLLAEETLNGWHASDGSVVFARRDGTVLRAPFSPSTLTFATEPVPVLDGIRTGGAGADMVLSGSGTLFYLTGAAMGTGNNAEVVSVTRDGIATRVDSTWTFNTIAGGGISLSPDGQRVAIAHRTGENSDIYVKQLPAGPFTRLTFEGNNMRPVWSSDGRSVIYVSRNREGQTNEDVFLRRADGSGSETLFYDDSLPVNEIRPTADSTQFIVRLNTSSRDIYLLTRRGDSVSKRPLLAEAYSESQAALSPDGHWLAYSSNESGTWEVYVRPFPDVNGGRWQVSRDGGNEPLWAHSGGELFYRGSRGRYMAARVNTTSSFSVGEHRVLFSTTGLVGTNTTLTSSITPDDRLFHFIRFVAGPAQTESGPSVLIKVENWLAELSGRR